MASEAGIPAPLIVLSWQTPSATDPDWFALERLAEALGGTGVARLQNSLIKTAGVASSVTVGLESGGGPNLFIVQVLVAPGKDVAQVEKSVHEEIERVAREGIPNEEMERLETEAIRRRAFQLVTTSIRAQVFAQILAAYGQLEMVNEWERQLHRVSSEDVKRVALKYLTPANRTVMILAAGAKP
jgi:predicted Zn-dependent peptidase